MDILDIKKVLDSIHEDDFNWIIDNSSQDIFKSFIKECEREKSIKNFLLHICEKDKRLSNKIQFSDHVLSLIKDMKKEVNYD